MRSPIWLPAHNPGPITGSGNNTWLLDGREPALVDAGVGKPAHVAAVAEALGGRPLTRVLITHGHTDHAAGVPALKARWPELIVCRFATDGHDEALRIVDGQDVRAGDTSLRVVHTPGHAPDHVCFWNPVTRDLFAGDMLVKGSTVMIPAGRGGNLAHYLTSLERLSSLGAARVYPGHGVVIDDPNVLIAQYVAHRHQREEEVLACLASGITTVDGIVAEIYGELPPAIHTPAVLTIEAHLEKLRGEGRV